MGISKTKDYSKSQQRLAQLFKAMGHPARISILQHLLAVNQCICGDIVEQLPLAQATVSQHLKALKEADLIQGNISGTSICYCINKESLQEVQSFIQGFATKLNNNNCC